MPNGQYKDTIQLNPEWHFGNFFLTGIVKGRDGFPKNRWIMDDSVTLVPSTATHKAYKASASNQSSPYSNPDAATTEFTAQEYINIDTETSGLVGAYATANQTNKYADAAMKFTFDTGAYSNITDIKLIWQGYYTISGVSNDWDCEMSTYKGTSWVDASGWSGYPNQGTPETELTKDGLGDGSDYFRYNGTASKTWIIFGVYGYIRRAGGTCTYWLYSDYAAITITYTAGGAAVETINAKTFPMEYLAKPVHSDDLISTVSGGTAATVSNDFPPELVKKGKASELCSKWF